MEKDLGRIKKNDVADIVIRVDDFGDRRGLTIREFMNGDRYTGFTKSGVRILAPDFPKFKEMINSITEEDMKEPSAGGESGGQTTPKEEVPVEKPEETAEKKENLPDY